MNVGQIGPDENQEQPASRARLPLGEPPERCRRPLDLAEETTGDLLRRATKGDERAWAALISRFGPLVTRVARRTGLNAADAADVHQAAWIQLMRFADQVRDPDRVGAWLATTARRQSQRIAKARCRQTTSPDPMVDYGPPERPNEGVEALVLHDHYEPALERALGRLPASYRRLLELLASDPGPSYEEVARSMGLPVGSIGPMRMRGLQMLRRDPELQDLGADRIRSIQVSEDDQAGKTSLATAV
jgi:RNA polymerase sigma factor (sigma-70 family)